MSVPAGIAEVDDYIDAQPAQRRERLRAVRALIIEVAPQAVPSMRYRMPTFELGGNWASMASQKQYMAVYFCAAELIEPIRMARPDLDLGVGCVRVRDRQEMPMELLRCCLQQALNVPGRH